MAKIVEKTTATNKKLRELITGLKNGTLLPHPDFQRRLVWTNKDKVNFLKTVLEGYPFPEIYVAAGEIDPNTAAGVEMLVDGQQRITTLYQYFANSSEIKLPKDFAPYEKLHPQDKHDFLEYNVVVRDLGTLSIQEIREVFTRINSTRYALNAMEINNARYDGAFKKFGEELAANEIFDRHRVFNAARIRRMEDVSYALTVVATVMSTYFARDKELAPFLERYNDEFPQEEDIRFNLQKVLSFIEACNLPDEIRAWKEADLFTLIVEVYKKLVDSNMSLNPEKVSLKLQRFYYEVDHYTEIEEDDLSYSRKSLDAYYAAIFQSTNDRTKRVTRGTIISEVLDPNASGQLTLDTLFDDI